MVQQKVVQMNAGDGETSYANNSGLQKTMLTRTWDVLDQTLKDMIFVENSMKMVDLGCASGPNTLFLVSHIIDTLRKNNFDVVTQLEVFLNDLPENDFNNLFANFLPDFNNIHRKNKNGIECFLYGAPGSFYDRLFPTNSLHFAYSSASLHWLSKIPEGVEDKNKENIHIAPTSPPQVYEAYAKQFEMDFFRFLSVRAEEMKNGGRMVLAFHGRSTSVDTDDDGLAVLTILSQTLSHMVAQGPVKEEDLKSFNVPIYAPFLQEIEDIIGSEGSFTLDKEEFFNVPWEADYDHDNDAVVFDKYKSGKRVAACVRAYMEPIIVGHFGASIDVDAAFHVYAGKMADYLSNHTSSSSYFIRVISLAKKFGK